MHNYSHFPVSSTPIEKTTNQMHSNVTFKQKHKSIQNTLIFGL